MPFHDAPATVSSSSSRSSSSSSSSSAGDTKQKQKQRDKKQKEKERRDALNARIQENLARREQADSEWHGWICSCGCKNLTMKARCNNCQQVRPLSAAQRGVGKAAAAIERGLGLNPPNQSKSRSRSSRRKSPRERSRRRERSRSRSSSSSSSSHEKKRNGDSAGAAAIETAKRDALQQFTAITKMESQAKMKAFRKLLREWHPDKNLHRVEVAKEVFQFLQKAGKRLL